ncbi:DNA repair protein RecN [uncultured Roseovarius sp.]|uniref:DNA repair protein RecN n=1 Tax=uncultured Roseovarius sp. TaxID=293344 RepID=UPI00261CC7C9|nr:DNA repair protein RecN [uncultured Roseovarius sp.]
MLRGLDIRDMLIIDRLELSFQPGLNVLTGETGAGKSILLDSLGFVLGWRGRAELVRAGAAQGEVQAVFDLPADHPARAILRDAGLPEEDELILRRINTSDGRKTAWVNDRRCSGEVLRRLSETLLELHGQHDDRGLLNPRGHRDLLDEFGKLSGHRDKVRAAWRAVAEKRKALDLAQAALEKVRAEEEFLRHAVAELDSLDPQPGEEDELDARRRLMQGAERIREDINKAAQALGSDGAEGRAGDALRWLEDAADKADGQLDEPIAALGRALVELDEAASGVTRCLETLSFDPLELEQTEERLFAIRALARKHDIVPTELGALADDLRGKLWALDQGDADVRVLRQVLTDAEAVYDASAQALSAARTKAAKRLDKAMMAELAPLKMDRAIFETTIAEAEPGPSGCDDVSFTVATNPGAPSGPLARIASGGELSRFLLALKVCLTGANSGLTLIFDEIDRGVGGATADAVGRRLSQLAGAGQVLVVTHSPQVAALAAHHWRVEKRVSQDQTLSTVTELRESARVDEIARMLSGDTITPEARSAAQALMGG